MKKIQINLFLTSALLLGLSSCLKKDAMNFDPDNKTASTLEIEYIAGGPGNAIGSGLQYFGGAAILFPLTDESDTATFNVRIAGPTLDKDLTVNVGVDNNSILDNHSKDGIDYAPMPTNLYKILDPTVTIKAGEHYAPVRVVFYPSQIDPLKDFMLPLTLTNSQSVGVSSNFGKLYLHTIGNPIAGSYLWDFYRYNNQAGTGSPSTTWTNEPIIFAPVSKTSIKVPTGYYTQPNYVISFTNTNGILSNFKVAFDPDELKAGFTNNSVTVVSGPTLTVSPDQKTFTIKYTVFNGAAYRNLTDIYHK